MKKAFLFILLLPAIKAFAQTRLEYGDFIQLDNKIEWAIETDQYLDLTPKFPNTALKIGSFKKMRDSGLVTYIKNPDGYSVTQTFTKDQNLKINAIIDTIDEDYKTFNYGGYNYLKNPDTSSLFYKNLSNCTCDFCDNRNLIDIIKVKQVVYYKDAKLYITNVLLTPMCFKEMITPQVTQFQPTVYSWYNLFNAGFNNNAYTEPTKQMIYIGTIEKIYSFQPDPSILNKERKILTSNTPCLARFLLRDWKKKKFFAYIPDSLTKLKNNEFPVRPRFVSVNIYNSNGEDAGTKLMPVEINIDSFYHFRIAQDVYFDRIKNILISQVKSITLMQQVYTDQGLYLGPASCATIYYDKMPEKKEQKYPTNKTRRN